MLPWQIPPNSSSKAFIHFSSSTLLYSSLVLHLYIRRRGLMLIAYRNLEMKHTNPWKMQQLLKWFKLQKDKSATQLSESWLIVCWWNLETNCCCWRPSLNCILGISHRTRKLLTSSDKLPTLLQKWKKFLKHWLSSKISCQKTSLGNTALWDVFKIFCPFIAENLLLFTCQSKIPYVIKPGLHII